MLLMVHLSFSHVKQLVMRLVFEKLQVHANQLWGLMLDNYTPTGCVKLCPPVFIPGGISFHRQIDSHFNKTRPVALKIWSCPVFKEKDQVAKLRAAIQQLDRKKLTASVMMVFILIATLCLKPWAAFVPVKKFFRLSLKTIFNVVVSEGTR